MLKQIYTMAAMLMMQLAAFAQNPITKTFSIDILTDGGEGKTIDISTNETGTMTFVGNPGSVYNKETGKYEKVENESLVNRLAGLTYNTATFKAYPSDNLLFLEFGFCISAKEHPEFSENIITSNTSSTPSVKLEYEDAGSYVLSPLVFDLSSYDMEKNWVLKSGYSSSNTFYPHLEGLGYVATYYIRPYVLLSGLNGDEIMYGNEIKVTTPKTKEAALLNDEKLKGCAILDSSLVISPSVVNGIVESAGITAGGARYGVAEDLTRYLYDSKEELAKTATDKIECTDGTINIIESLPDDVSKGFMAYLQGGVEFSPVGYCIGREEMLPGSNVYVTKNVGSIDMVECDESLGVPYNKYVKFNSLRTTNTSYGIRIPKYLLDREYDVYVVLVNPDLDEDERTYRFRSYMWEQTEYNVYPGKGKVMALEDGTNVFETQSVPVETVYLGSYEFNGNPRSIIQLATNVTSRLRTQYKITMCVAQIKIVPKE